MIDHTQTESELPPPPPPPPSPALDAPPGYAIERQLGEGGMGVVLLARQAGLNRPVALKMVRAGMAVDPKALIRFLAEAEAVAAVRHPNVVEVYAYGDHHGRPYLAMEFCPGGSLADRIKAGERFDPRTAAKLVAAVADGVGAAHALSIVHRDLKPHNVLIGANGEPKVSDFGLAKRGAGQDLTHTGAVMGTPAYMSPEQAGGGAKFVGPAADVWALGVMLYELLTGTRPFAGQSSEEVLAQVLASDPEPIHKHLPELPRDLGLVCGKCLEKDPADRYPTAVELAADLRRFMAGEPISVRSASWVERTAKWAKRKPTAAAAWVLGVVALGLGSGGAAAGWQWRQAEAARVLVAAEKQQTDDALKRESRAKDDESAARKQAEAARGDAEVARDELTAVRYARTVDLAYREYRANDLPRAKRLLAECPPDRRGWEWAYVHRLCNTEHLRLDPKAGHAYSVGYDSDGKRLISAHADKKARIWDAASGRLMAKLDGHDDEVHDAVFAPDGRWAATSSADGTVKLWDTDTGLVIASLKESMPPDLPQPKADAPKGDPGPSGPSCQEPPSRENQAQSTPRKESPSFPSFPDNIRYVLHKGPFDSIPPPSRTRLVRKTKSVFAVTVSPDGKYIAAGGTGGMVCVWQVNDKRVVFRLAGTGDIQSLRYSPDGKWIAVGGTKGLRVWKLGTEEPKLDDFASGSESVTALAFASDGRFAFGDAEGVVRILRIPERLELLVVQTHFAGVTGVDFTPDGKRLLTTSRDRSVGVWDAANGRAMATFKGHVDATWSVSADPTGKCVSSAGLDGTVRVWDLKSGHDCRSITVGGGDMFAISPDGRWLVVGQGNGFVPVIDLVTEQVVKPRNELLSRWSRPRIVANGSDTHDITAQPQPNSSDGKQGVPDAPALIPAIGRTGIVAMQVNPTNAGVTQETASDRFENYYWAISTEGKSSGGAFGERHFVPTGWSISEEQFTSKYNLSYDCVKVYSSTLGTFVAALCGSLRAIGLPNGKVVLWDGSNVPREVVTYPSGVGAVAFDAGGSRLFVGGAGGVIGKLDRNPNLPVPVAASVWNLSTRMKIADLDGHTAGVMAAAFSPDGRLVATGSADFTARLWDAATGRQLHILSGHLFWVRSVAFSPDGRRLATGGPDGTVKVWDVVTGNELLSLPAQTDGISHVAFTPDGSKLIASGYDGTIRVWDAGTAGQPPLEPAPPPRPARDAAAPPR